MDPLCPAVQWSESGQQLLPVNFFYTGCSENSPTFQCPSCPSGVHEGAVHHGDCTGLVLEAGIFGIEPCSITSHV